SPGLPGKLLAARTTTAQRPRLHLYQPQRCRLVMRGGPQPFVDFPVELNLRRILDDFVGEVAFHIHDLTAVAQVENLERTQHDDRGVMQDEGNYPNQYPAFVGQVQQVRELLRGRLGLSPTPVQHRFVEQDEHLRPWFPGEQVTPPPHPDVEAN